MRDDIRVKTGDEEPTNRLSFQDMGFYDELSSLNDCRAKLANNKDWKDYIQGRIEALRYVQNNPQDYGRTVD